MSYDRTLPVNLTKFFTDFIIKNYDEKTLKENVEAIKFLNDLRNTALCKLDKKLDERLKNTTEYYYALKTIEPLITLSEEPLFAYTTWYDIFSKKKKSKNKKTDNRLSFEIANVLSFLVSLQNEWYNGESKKYTMDSKYCTQHCELIVEYLTEMKLYSQKDELSSKMVCISEDYANITINTFICAAQRNIASNIACGKQNYSQLLCMWHFILERAMNSLYIINKSKECLLVFEEYCAVERIFSLDIISRIQSFMSNMSVQYGPHLANIEIAYDYANRCNIKYNEPIIQDLWKIRLDDYLRAKEENEMINSEAVPKSPNIPKVDNTQLLEPVFLNITNRMNEKAFIPVENVKGLTQIVVHKAKKKFFSYISKIMDKLSISIKQYNSIIDSLLVEINRSDYFENYISKNTSSSIIDEIRELCSEVEIVSAGKRIMDIENLCILSTERLNKAWETLREEENSDKNYREKYGLEWSRVLAPTATKLCRETLQTYEKYLITSKKADNYLKQQFVDLNSSYMIIPSSYDFYWIINAKNNLIESSDVQLFGELKKAYEEICKIKVQQQNILKQYEKIENEIDSYFTKEFYKDCTMTIEAHVNALTATFEPINNKLEASIGQQDSIKTLLSINEKINSIECLNSNLDRIHQNYNLYVSIRGGICKGLDFYDKLTGNLANIQTRIENFCISRDSEAKELIKCIEAARDSQYNNSENSNFLNTRSLSSNDKFFEENNPNLSEISRDGRIKTST